MIELDDSEYHRRRAEIEMDRALHAKLPEAALLHLELAKEHRQRREELALRLRLAVPDGGLPISRTDKES